jgi:EpsI family protein
MHSRARWIPAGLLVAGCLVNGVIAGRRIGPVPLRAPLSTVGVELRGLRPTDDTVATDVRRVAGMSSYILRSYGPAAAAPLFSVYVGYYDDQHQGKTIHSPKNCLPGDGWEPVESGPITIATASGPVTVNRYRVAKEGYSAMVYYWYQGRGRVAHDEFRVKYELLRDAALRGRTEEALVRIVVPVTGENVAAADTIARGLVAPLVAAMDQVLPTY